MHILLSLIRYNYLNDLPSLDPELYRHLIFLKVILSSPFPFFFLSYLMEKYLTLFLIVILSRGLHVAFLFIPPSLL